VASSNEIARAVRRGYESSILRTPEAHAERSFNGGRQNPLREFLENRKEGPGIFKWDHYFTIYDRHFRKFRGQKVHVLEIGIFSGGSLEMWLDYFGPQAMIYGVDIVPECRTHERDRVKIFIRDQANRTFWRDIRKIAPPFDVVIDDGGHQPEQQIVSFEELFPFMPQEGVYLCEDVHGGYNPFASYVHGLSHRLNDCFIKSQQDKERSLVSDCTPFQSAVSSIHFYPFITILERSSLARTQFWASKHGTQWLNPT
jgi:hypothetical protein